MGLCLHRTICHSTAYGTVWHVHFFICQHERKLGWSQHSPRAVRRTLSQFFLMLDLKTWHWFPNKGTWCQLPSYLENRKHEANPMWGHRLQGLYGSNFHQRWSKFCSYFSSQFWGATNCGIASPPHHFCGLHLLVLSLGNTANIC